MGSLTIRDFRIKLLLLAIMHLAIDGLCAYLVFSRLYPQNPTASFTIFLGYNLLAFVTQSPVGMLMDKYNRPKLFLGASVLAILIGYALAGVWQISVLLIGFGNSFFHVAGGRYVTDKSGNDVSHLGIFVSTGAIGLALGNFFSFSRMFPLLLFIPLVASFILIIVSGDSENKTSPMQLAGGENANTIALILIMAVVLARSFVGRVATPSFESTSTLMLLISVATALGKAVGGIMSKKLGTVVTVIASMGVAAVCLTLATSVPFLYILGVFAFNFSMPMTLYYANVILKGREGFAFGTLAAVLMPGYLFGLLFGYTLWIKLLTVLLCALSVFVIIFVSRRTNNALCTDYDRGN